MAIQTALAEELIKMVQLANNPTEIEKALANKLIESEDEHKRLKEVFYKLSSIVDSEL